VQSGHWLNAPVATQQRKPHLSYIAHIDGVEYRTMAEAQINENEIEFLVSLYKKSGKEWLVYVGDDSWERGPGENFF